MKKKIFLGAFALLGFVANAQNSKVKFGIKGGYVLSTIKEKYSNMSNSGDPKSSFYVGGLVEYRIDNQWGLQGEILYADLGGRDEVNLGTQNVNGQNVYVGNVKQKTNLSTIVVPIGAKYFVTNNFTVNGGFNFAFYVSKDIKNDLTQYGTSVNISGDDILKTFNFAPYLGLEYQFDNGLFVDSRYNFGVANISKVNVDGYKVRNSFFQIGLGYKFK
ncbi:hypothetical protein CMU89_01280 [Elizabethkingia anophelis]|uniref:porin family protein n=1 Tax=Elizabethkingia anophelis TaxID=1117645 RepID=UPI00293C38BA|nr:hypothetical protein [Elizabethkingia anophelis]MDV3541302.1 hypothetical protein [Elizabethkingia anophelis]MDV3755393.1 hypothetical protein [Elizabethkingia anophelis]